METQECARLILAHPGQTSRQKYNKDREDQSETAPEYTLQQRHCPGLAYILVSYNIKEQKSENQEIKNSIGLNVLYITVADLTEMIFCSYKSFIIFRVCKVCVLSFWTGVGFKHQNMF